MNNAIVILLLGALPALAQGVKFPPELERLASKAVETTNVTLDSGMLKSMAGLLGTDEVGQKTKDLASRLKGIWVRSFKFAKEGEYSMSDLESIRSAIRGPGWSSVISVRDKNDSADVAIKREGDRIVGLVVLAAEPKELTFVNIEGPVDLSQLGNLGSLGVPNINTGFKRAPAGGDVKK
jgi:hypothetical protein